MDSENKQRIYLASPLGFTESGRHYIGSVLFPKLASLKNVEFLDPWEAVLRMSERQIMNIPRDLKRQKAIGYGEENFRMIDKAGIVLACLDGADPDSGTCIEVGYAYRAGKLVIGYRTDYRLSGESRELRMNLQVETAIRKSGGEVFSSLNDAIEFIRAKTENKKAPVKIGR